MRTQDTTLDDLTNAGAAKDFFTRRKLPPFEPAAKGFSLANALWLIELSRIAYRREAPEAGALVPSRSGFLESAGLRQIQPFDNKETDTQAMLVVSTRGPKFAALVFRGTEKRPKDIVTDILLHAKDAHDDIHAGFARAINSVWNQIVPFLDKLDCPVFYTGHSLGAALATLAALKRPAPTYAFGSPRVGGPKFAAAMKNAVLFRVVDDQDIVTTVPLEAMGFVHVGSERKLHERPAPGFMHLEKPAADHAPVNYLDRLT